MLQGFLFGVGITALTLEIVFSKSKNLMVIWLSICLIIGGLNL